MDHIGYAELLHKSVQYVQILPYLPLGILVIPVGRVGFKEMYLPHPDECPSLFCLVSECADYLVYLQRKVRMRANPEGEHGVHRGLTCWPEQEFHIQLVLPCVCDPVNILSEAFYVLRLLGELSFWDECGKIDLVVTCGIELLSYQ